MLTCKLYQIYSLSATTSCCAVSTQASNLPLQAITLRTGRITFIRPFIWLASRPGGNLVVDLAEVFLREIAREADWNAAP